MKTTLTLLSLFLLIQLKCQDLSDLVAYRDSTEQELFDALIYNPNDIESAFSLFIQSARTLDSVKESRVFQSIDAIAESIKATKEFRKKQHKLSQVIHEELHENLFKYYGMETAPIDIFDDGEFNCVTGTGVVAYMAHKLGYETRIREQPNHVYPEVIIDGVAYAIETTDPGFGYRKYDAKVKQSLVKSLKAFKLIPEEELGDLTDEETFDKLYATKPQISFKELVALQYNNQGVFAAEKKDYTLAIENLMKAFVLFPDQRLKLGLQLSLANYFIQKDASDDNFQRFLVVLSRMTKETDYASLLYPVYIDFANKTIIDGSDIDKYKEVSAAVLRNLYIKDLKKQLTFEYEMRLGNHHLVLGDFDIALPLIESCLDYEKDHKVALAMLIHAKAKLCEVNNFSQEEIEGIFELNKKYKTIQEQYEYRELLLYATGNYCIQQMDKSNFRVVRERMEVLDQTLNAKTHHDDIDIRLAQLFKDLSIRFFRVGHNQTALKYINTALEKLPNNPEFIRLKQVYVY